jgi:hypothetical protein
VSSVLSGKGSLRAAIVIFLFEFWLKSVGATLTWIKAYMGAACILFPSPKASGAIEIKIWLCARIALACGGDIGIGKCGESNLADSALHRQVRLDDLS